MPQGTPKVPGVVGWPHWKLRCYTSSPKGPVPMTLSLQVIGLGFWVVRRAESKWRHFGTILGGMGLHFRSFWYQNLHILRSWGVWGSVWSPMAAQGGPGNQKTLKKVLRGPSPGDHQIDQKSTKTGKRAAESVKSGFRDPSRRLLRFWPLFGTGPGRGNVVET